MVILQLMQARSSDDLIKSKLLVDLVSKAVCMHLRVRTVTVIVGVERDEDDLDHGEEDEAVDDDGQHAEDVVLMLDAILEGVGVDVERRRAEVGVEDAHALERQP